VNAYWYNFFLADSAKKRSGDVPLVVVSFVCTCAIFHVSDTLRRTAAWVRRPFFDDNGRSNSSVVVVVVANRNTVTQDCTTSVSTNKTHTF
jgi:hypothetical protein